MRELWSPLGTSSELGSVEHTSLMRIRHEKYDPAYCHAWMMIAEEGVAPVGRSVMAWPSVCIQKQDMKAYASVKDAIML